MFERELAPTIMVMTFCISVGAYYVWGVIFTLLMIIAGIYLLWAYIKDLSKHVVVARIAVFAVTCLFFIVLLSDDHVFEDSTLP